ncbi:MAG: flagellar FliJ family protein [Alphaproteobacteria bacterium]
MKSLDTLIRLQKWQLDEKRRQLVELRRMYDDLCTAIARLDQEIAAEATLATSDPSLGATFGVFAQAARGRRDKLVASRAELDARIEGAEQEIAEAFGELKKIEVTKQGREARAQAQLARREQAALDEVGGLMMRRRQVAAAAD